MIFDLRSTVRTLIKSPSYTAITLLTLMLGIAVSTSMFSVVNALVLRRWPYPHADRLVSIQTEISRRHLELLAIAEVREIREHATSFSSLTCLINHEVAVSEAGQITQRQGEIAASADLFTTIGLQPLIGRAFTAEETQQGKNSVILLGEHYWREYFNADPATVGKTLRVDGQVVTIIGVLPATFEHLPLRGQAVAEVALWRPLNYAPEWEMNRGVRLYSLIGRLKDGVSPQQAEAELAPLARQQESEHPVVYPSVKYTVRLLSRTLMSSTGTKITWMLFALSGFVLLIACANLANLQLARVSADAHGLAVRLALGATPRNLLGRQLLESFVLSAVGGALGCAVAVLINHFIGQHISVNGMRGQKVPIDSAVLAVNLSTIAATSLLFGALPAWFASRVNVNSVLKGRARGSSEGSHQQTMRRSLIVAEVGLALVLLAGAGIMERGLRNFLHHNSGWDTEHILTAILSIPPSRSDTYEKTIGYVHNVEVQLANNPAVEGVAIATALPLMNYGSSIPVFADAQASETMGQHLQASITVISSNYFSTMGIPFIRGAKFDPGIKNTDTQLIIVNQSLARHFWPDGDAIGKRLACVESEQIIWRQVVGVVADVESAADFDNPSTRFQTYVPHAQEPWGWFHIVLRGRNPQALEELTRRTLLSIDPDAPPDSVITASHYISSAHSNVSLIADILSGFSVLGVILAAIGIYGVISHFVGNRRVEFGIRMALGSQPRGILNLVLKQGLALALIGTAMGLVGAYFLGRSLQIFLPRMANPDPLVLAISAVSLMLVSLLACWIPARRATRIDPLIAMRAE